jgi:tape measure domain-containing protein
MPNMFGSTKVGGVHLDITANDAGYAEDLKRAETQARRAGAAMHDAMAKADATSRKASASVGGMHMALSGLVSAGLLAHIGRQALQAADSFTQMRSKLGLVVQEGEDLLAIEEKLADQAMGNRSQLEGTVALYARLRSARASITDDTAQKMVDTWNKTLVISGASSQGAAMSTIQFSQAMAGGILRAEEFNAIVENNIRAVQLFASSLGVTVGELRNLVNEGKVTFEDLQKALTEDAGAVEAEFARMGMTSSQAMTNLGTAMTRLIGVMDQQVGASAAVAKWIDAVATAAGNAAQFLAGQDKTVRDLASALRGYEKALSDVHTAQAGDIEQKNEMLAQGREALKQKLDDARAERHRLELIAKDKPSYLQSATWEGSIQRAAAASAARQVEVLNQQIAATETMIAAADQRFEDLIQRRMVETARTGRDPKATPDSPAKPSTKPPVVKDIQQIGDAAEDASEELRALFDNIEAIMDAPLGDVWDELGYSDAMPEIPEFTWPEQIWDGFGDNVRDATKWGLMEAFETDDWGDAFGNTLRQVASNALSRAVDGLLDAMSAQSSSGGGNLWSSLLSGIGSFFGGNKADGGPVRGGVAYTVGERGAETFVPTTNGFVIPNMRGAAIDASRTASVSNINVGGTSIVINGNADSLTIRQLQDILETRDRALAPALDRRLAQRRAKKGF